MNVKFKDIELTEKNKKLIIKTFEQYRDFRPLPNSLEDINERIVIHIYPYKDTDDGTNIGEGYMDSLLFMANIYLTRSEIVYSTTHHDAIILNRVVGMRIFKDQSTMIIIDPFTNTGLQNPINISKSKVITID